MRFAKTQLTPLLVALLSGAVLIAGHNKRIHALKRNYQLEAPPPMSELQPNIVRIITLGFKPAYDDFISIWLLQSLMDTRPRDPDKLQKTIRAVIRHRPKLETIYMLSCFVMIRDFDRPDFCREVNLAGLEAFPKSWRLAMTQAYVEYFLLKQPLQAASFFSMAASRPDSPIYVKNLVAKLIKEANPTPEDIQASLELLSKFQGGEIFKDLLNNLENRSKETKGE